jgi:predicted nucleotidyltransferase
MALRHQDVDEVLHGFLESAQSILGDQFVGMYLYGSLATGDFSPDRSDIDFVVVTAGELSDAHLKALTQLHDLFAASDSPWATEIDGSYIPRDSFRRYDLAQAIHPHVERGVGKLRLERFQSDWVIQRHVMRERGVVLAGPAPHELIDTVGAAEIRQAVRELALHSWAPLEEESIQWERGGQVYAILTMCRMLHTLETDSLISKRAAGQWAREALGEPFAPLIDRALAWKKTDSQKTATEDAVATAALIRLVVNRWQDAGVD